MYCIAAVLNKKPQNFLFWISRLLAASLGEKQDSVQRIKHQVKEIWLRLLLPDVELWNPAHQVRTRPYPTIGRKTWHQHIEKISSIIWVTNWFPYESYEKISYVWWHFLDNLGSDGLGNHRNLCTLKSFLRNRSAGVALLEGFASSPPGQNQWQIWLGMMGILQIPQNSIFLSKNDANYAKPWNSVRITFTITFPSMSQDSFSFRGALFDNSLTQHFR
jgi:hypothetical protein